MRKILSVLTFLLLACLAADARKISPSALGTVCYDVRYKLGAMNAKVATATISFDRATREDQAVYHSHALIRTSSIFRLFLSSDYTVDSWISQNGLTPVYFINPFKKGGKDGKFECIYRPTGIEVVNIVPPKTDEHKVLAQDGRTMDLLTLLHFVRFLDLSARDKPIALKVLMGGIAYPGVLTYKGMDAESVPGVEAERFLLHLTERGLMENGSGNIIHFWRSTGPDRRLLGLEVALSTGAMSIRISE